jgi:hypothetical protein
VAQDAETLIFAEDAERITPKLRAGGEFLESSSALGNSVK